MKLVKRTVHVQKQNYQTIFIMSKHKINHLEAMLRVNKNKMFN